MSEDTIVSRITEKISDLRNSQMRAEVEILELERDLQAIIRYGLHEVKAEYLASLSETSFKKGDYLRATVLSFQGHSFNNRQLHQQLRIQFPEVTFSNALINVMLKRWRDEGGLGLDDDSTETRYVYFVIPDSPIWKGSLPQPKQTPKNETDKTHANSRLNGGSPVHTSSARRINGDKIAGNGSVDSNH